MVEERLIDHSFMEAMEDGLERGRKKGRVGWDRGWLNTKFDEIPLTSHGQIFEMLQRYVRKLAIEIDDTSKSRDVEKIKKQAANVANLAMMVADIHEALND